jgi:hypothetical protein
LNFALARQALYHLSHASSPFCSHYFGDEVLLFAHTGLDLNPPVLCRYIFFFPTWADLELDPSDLSLLHSWDNRNAPLYWLRWGLENYLPRLTLNQNPPDLSLLSS